jgi:hypothetical protein
MLGGKNFKAMDRSFRDVTKIDAPFGGKTAAIGARFLQL